MNDSDIDEDSLPQFVLTIVDDGQNDIDILPSFTKTPSPLEHASLGLMYGLAILMLDREGAMEDIVEALLKTGPMSEVDCVNAISLLMSQEHNDLPN
jgi:hypothetical protein